MPTTITTDFPLSVIILCYIATFLLIVILLVLLKISSQLNAPKSQPTSSSRSSGSTKLAEPTGTPNIPEIEPGGPFDQFLSEDPERKNLTKKEQFKAYRKWRSEKGLNWAKTNGEDEKAP